MDLHSFSFSGGTISNMKQFSLFVIIIFFFTKGVAQALLPLVKQKGTPSVINHNTNNYNADPLNFDVTQDERGIMYFANSSGVLEYDGNTWRMLKLPNESRVYSLAYDKQTRRVYVGGVGDFGYLSSDSQGITKFISLKSLVPEKLRDFKHVWLTFVTPHQGIIFFTTSGVYLLKDGKIKTFSPSSKNPFHAAFFVKNNLYVREWGVGLKKLNGKQLKLVPNGEAFANERIYAMLPYNAQSILVITRTKGLFLYDGQNFTPWHSELTPKFLEEAQVYFSKTLGNSYFALATTKKGVIILNKRGKIIQQIDESAGLVTTCSPPSIL